MTKRSRGFSFFFPWSLLFVSALFLSHTLGACIELSDRENPSIEEICKHLIDCDSELEYGQCLIDLRTFFAVLNPTALSVMADCMVDLPCYQYDMLTYWACMGDAMWAVPADAADEFFTIYCQHMIDCKQYLSSVKECVPRIKGLSDYRADVMGVLNEEALDCVAACSDSLSCDQLKEYFFFCTGQCELLFYPSENACSKHGTWEADHCVCYEGYVGTRCEACAEGYLENGEDCVLPP